MPRPLCCRRVGGPPEHRLFKPAGIPSVRLPEVVMTLDELEAVRLADLDGLYQEEAAARMNVSRQTFGRIVASARKKVAGALVEGKCLRIEGGEVEMIGLRTFRCAGCGEVWQAPYGTGRPAGCAACGGENFHRIDGGRGTCRPRSDRGRAGRGEKIPARQD